MQLSMRLRIALLITIFIAAEIQRISCDSLIKNIAILAILGKILKPKFLPLPLPVPLPIKIQKHTHKPYLVHGHGHHLPPLFPLHGHGHGLPLHGHGHGLPLHGHGHDFPLLGHGHGLPLHGHELSLHGHGHEFGHGHELPFHAHDDFSGLEFGHGLSDFHSLHALEELYAANLKIEKLLEAIKLAQLSHGVSSKGSYADSSDSVEVIDLTKLPLPKTDSKVTKASYSHEDLVNLLKALSHSDSDSLKGSYSTNTDVVDTSLLKSLSESDVDPLKASYSTNVEVTDSSDLEVWEYLKKLSDLQDAKDLDDYKS